MPSMTTRSLEDTSVAAAPSLSALRGQRVVLRPLALQLLEDAAAHVLDGARCLKKLVQVVGGLRSARRG